MDLEAHVPVGGRNAALDPDPLLDVLEADLGQLAEGPLAEARALALPVHVLVLVGHRDQHVEGAVTGGREGRVTDDRVLDVEARVLAQDGSRPARTATTCNAECARRHAQPTLWDILATK